jgi:hypothetical protein
MPPEGLARRPFPVRISTFWFSLPSCRLSFRVPSSQPPLCAFARRATCLGSRPPSDITSPLPIVEPPQLDWRHPRRSQPLDGFCDGARELVSSRSQIQDSFSFRGLSTFVQPSAFIRLATPLPFSIRTLTCEQAATHEHLDFDVFLHTKPLSMGSAISLPDGRAPLRVRLLLQANPTSAMTAYPSSIAHAVALASWPTLRGEHTSTRALDFSAFPTLASSSCLQDLRPARAFRTFQPAFQRA